MFVIPNSPNIVGDALQKAIGDFAGIKMGQLMQRHQQSNLVGALTKFGIPEDRAKAFASLPSNMQEQFIKSGILSSLQAPSRQDVAQSQESFPQMRQLQPSQQQVQQPEDQIMKQMTQQLPIEQPSINPYTIMQRATAGGFSPQQVQEMLSTQPVQKPTQVKTAQRVVKGKEKQEPMPLLTTAKERADQLKLQKELMKASREEQHAIDKQVKPYVDTIDKKGGQAANTADMILDRMNKLIDSGNLTGSTMYNFRKKMEHAGHLIGGGLGAAAGGIAGSVIPGLGTVGGATIGGGLGTAFGEALMPKFVGSKEDQEFTKLSLNFMDKLKDIFGGRIAIQEMQMYMDSIPTLAMTDEGKKQVIKDMKLISSGWRHKKQIKDKIVAANGGRYPADLEQQVEAASQPFMDKMAKEFVG